MLLGIDAGGTSTRAVIVDETGRCLGYGTAGGGNPISRGTAQAGRAIFAAASEALDAAISRASRQEIDATGRNTAVLAMAGASAFVMPEVMASDLRALGGIDQISVVSDLLGMFTSGTHIQSGYGLVSGTGAAAIRVEDGGIAAAADGLGWLLGDVGSGFWIGHRVVRSALAALSGHGPATILGVMVKKALDIEHDLRRQAGGRLLALQTAVDQLYQMQPVELSQFAGLAFEAAGITGSPGNPSDGGSLDQGPAEFPETADPVSVKILVEARQRLIATLEAVQIVAQPGPVVLGGTVARRLPGLAQGVRESFSTAQMTAPEIVAVADGAVGAAVLALRESGVVVTREVFEQVTASVAACR